MRKIYFQAKQLKGWLSVNESRAVYDLAKRLTGDVIVVEIGSFQGKSTICMATALKENGRGTVFAIDPHLGQTHVGKKEFPATFKQFLTNIKKFDVEKWVFPMRMKSYEACKKWKKKIDLLHIDGLHEYEFVKEDIAIWWPFLKNGGFLVCHDAFSPEPDVYQAIKELIIDSGDFSYIAPNDSQLIIQKGSPKGFWGKMNKQRLTWFVNLSLLIWQNEKFPIKVRHFIVNRILKFFFMNQFMFNSMLNRFSHE